MMVKVWDVRKAAADLGLEAVFFPHERIELRRRDGRELTAGGIEVFGANNAADATNFLIGFHAGLKAAEIAQRDREAYTSQNTKGR